MRFEHLIKRLLLSVVNKQYSFIATFLDSFWRMDNQIRSVALAVVYRNYHPNLLLLSQILIHFMNMDIAQTSILFVSNTIHSRSSPLLPLQTALVIFPNEVIFNELLSRTEVSVNFNTNYFSIRRWHSPRNWIRVNIAEEFIFMDYGRLFAEYTWDVVFFGGLFHSLRDVVKNCTCLWLLMVLQNRFLHLLLEILCVSWRH